MRDIRKFRNIGDFLLEQGNYIQAYDMYYKTYSQIWIALAKYKTDLNKRSALNGHEEEIKEMIRYSNLNKLFFEYFKMDADSVQTEFIYTILGRLKCLYFSKSLEDEFSLALVKNEFLLLHNLILHKHDISWVWKVFEIFEPVASSNKLRTININYTQQTITNRLIESAEKMHKQGWSLINRLLLEMIYTAGAHKQKLFESIAEIDKSQINEKPLKLKDFTELADKLFKSSGRFDHNKSTENEKAIYYGKLLGLEGKVAKSEIRKLYHQKISIYHPDRLKNISDETRTLIEFKSRELNTAFEWFKEKYNI